MFKNAGLTVIENNASVYVEYDENNDIYNLTLTEFDEGTTVGNTTTHESKNVATVQIEKKDVRQIIKMLEFATFNE